MSTDRDINDLFDDIILTEERLSASSFEEGFAVGCAQGNEEGYRLGYAQGIQLGEELAEIFGRVVALQQHTKHTEKVKRCLLQLKECIEEFPRDNDPEADIVGAVENIRTLNKKLLTLVGHKTKNPEENLQTKNLNF